MEENELLQQENRLLRLRLESVTKQLSEADRLNINLTRENKLAHELIQVLEKNIGTLQGQMILKKLINQ